MKRSILAKADALMLSGQQLSMESMEGFVHETLKFFEELKGVIAHGSEAEKKEAFAISQELQEKLQTYAQKAYEQTGQSPEEAQQLLEPKNFSEKDWSTFQKAEKEIQEYKKQISNTKEHSQKKTPVKHHGKERKNWNHKI